MTEHPVVGRTLWCAWQTLTDLLQAPETTADIVVGGIGVVAMLMPLGDAWQQSNITDTFISAAVLDWVKGLLGLIFLLRRRFGSSHGD